MVCVGCAEQADGTVMREEQLVADVWGFRWEQRWYQPLEILAFIVVFMAIGLLSATYLRHVK